MNHAAIGSIMIPEIVRLILAEYEKEALDKFYNSATGAIYADDRTCLYCQSAYRDMIPAIAPVRWYTLLKAVYHFSNDMKLQSLSLTYHVPTALSPFIGILKDEIRGHVGKKIPSSDVSLYCPCLFFLIGK